MQPAEVEDASPARPPAVQGARPDLDLDAMIADFEGGGTAFWRPEHYSDARRGRAEPAIVLKPAAGAALLFGGEVTHAGKPVHRGTRCVFVASFSPKRDAANECPQGEANQSDEQIAGGQDEPQPDLADLELLLDAHLKRK